MNLDELLAFKPKKVELRETEDDLVEKTPPLKRARKEETNTPTSTDENGLTDEEKLKLLQTVAEDEDLGEALDAGAVKRMLLNFEKKVLKNQEMRIKFPDLPEKFMESEIELNDEIQKLHVIATVPEHYPILIELNILETLVGLLSHDNSDVAIAVIDLLQEMTDVDALNDSEEEAIGLMDALLKQQVRLGVGVWRGKGDKRKGKDFPSNQINGKRGKGLPHLLHVARFIPLFIMIQEM